MHFSFSRLKAINISVNALNIVVKIGFALRIPSVAHEKKSFWVLFSSAEWTHEEWIQNGGKENDKVD